MYDVIIIGAGPTGMGAGIYSARFGLKTLIIGFETGGLLNESHLVENYPGFKAIPGAELMMKFKEHVDSLNIPIKNTWVKSIEKKDDYFLIKADKEYEAKTIILATGTKHRKLGLPKEEELAGKGISYCATCDAAFNKDKVVGVVGGGDSAAHAALILSKFASKVIMLVRKEFKAEPINKNRVINNPKIEIKKGVSVVELLSDDKGLTGVKLDNGEEISLNSLFVEIGSIPQNELAESLGVALNDRKEIIIDEESKTNIPGVFAAGDCCNRRFKQAITGVAEGVIAAFSANEFLKKEEKNI